MAAPRFTFSHGLDPLKGWPSPYAVDFTAKLSANVTISPFYAGRVVHLNASGELETGMGTSNNKMPMFTLQNSDDPSVKNDGGTPSTDTGVWVGISPSGGINCLVAVGAYELESTEYVTGTSYAPGDWLKATFANTNAATGGVIDKQATVTSGICGVVSRGARTNAHGVSVLAFWPWYLPAGV